MWAHPETILIRNIRGINLATKPFMEGLLSI
jgi:hypothetical protein